MKKEEIKQLKEAAKKKILKVHPNGGYSHNVIGFVLSSLASKTSKETANELIDELNLCKKFGIAKAVIND